MTIDPQPINSGLMDSVAARRYRALRAYAQAVRDWFTAHPDHKPGDKWEGEPRPWFSDGVIIALSGDDLDAACDEYLAQQ